MTNYMKIAYYLRKSSINPQQAAVYITVTVNQQRITLGAVTVVSGFEIPKIVLILAANWDPERQRVKKTDKQAILVNKAIEECERKLNKLYAQHEGYDVRMTTKVVKACIRDNGKMRPTMPDLIEKFLAEKTLLQAKASTIDTYHWKPQRR